MAQGTPSSHFAAGVKPYPIRDLPYLRQLAQRNPSTYQTLAQANSACETMQLFRRYIDLYQAQETLQGVTSLLSSRQGGNI
jgi:hypothetical protein